MLSTSHDRDPKQCWWCDNEDYYWECLNCKKNDGEAKPGHSLTRGKCKFAKPRGPHGSRGQGPPAPAELAAASPAATAASEAPAAKQ
eukprot:4471568-Pyramimonas_sp.AAC.1